MLLSDLSVLLIDSNAHFSSQVARELEARGIVFKRASTSHEADGLLRGAASAEWSYSHVVAELELSESAVGDAVLSTGLPRRSQLVMLSRAPNSAHACQFADRAIVLPRSGLTGSSLVELLVRTTVTGIRGFAAAVGFSPREYEVLLCIVDGCTVSDTARQLRCQASTVKTYIQRMFDKTGRGSQVELLGFLVSWLTSDSGSTRHPALRQSSSPVSARRRAS